MICSSNHAELSTSELLYGELVALQEQLARWLVDYVVKPGAEYNILGCDAYIYRIVLIKHCDIFGVWTLCFNFDVWILCCDLVVWTLCLNLDVWTLSFNLNV